MKLFIDYLKDHLKADFRWDLYIGVFAFLLGSFYINYTFDFEESIIDSFYGQEIRILWYFLFYSFAYYTTLLAWAILHKQTVLLKNYKLWVFSTFCILCQAVDGSFYYHIAFSKAYLPSEIFVFGYRLLGELYFIVSVIIPFFLFYKFYDKESSYFYGMKAKWNEVKWYFLMLLGMVPLVFGASFEQSFLDAYPNYRFSQAHLYLGVSEWLTILVSEVCYAGNFISVELLFRGFLIIGMARFLGRGTVLPMVVMYAFLHFGKPMGEAIGSIFGGYILGVIALRSRNIFGGIIIHMGVAMLMEIAAFYQIMRN